MAGCIRQRVACTAPEQQAVVRTRAARAVPMQRSQTVSARFPMCCTFQIYLTRSTSDRRQTPCSGDEAEWLDATAKGQPDQDSTNIGNSGANQGSQSSARAKELEGLTSDSDVLTVPKFVDAEGAS